MEATADTALERTPMRQWSARPGCRTVCAIVMPGGRTSGRPPSCELVVHRSNLYSFRDRTTSDEAEREELSRGVMARLCQSH